MTNRCVRRCYPDETQEPVFTAPVCNVQPLVFEFEFFLVPVFFYVRTYLLILSGNVRRRTCIVNGCLETTPVGAVSVGLSAARAGFLLVQPRAA